MATIAKRVRALRDEAGVAGDEAMVAICTRALEGDSLSIQEIHSLLETFEINASDFWAAAAGGDRVPLDLRGFQASVDEMES